MAAGDKVSNEFDEKVGQAKEWVGEHTDNPELAEEGRGEQTDAHTHQAGEHVKDAAHDAGHHLSDAADEVKEAFKRD